MIDTDSKFGRMVKRHLNREYVVWLTTVGPGPTPQPRPVWFIWDGDSFLIFSQAKAHKVKHIRRNAQVALHFNTDETGEKHVIVFTGRARLDEGAAPAHKVPAYFKKYKAGIADLKMSPEEFSRYYSVAIRITPGRVRGW